MQAMEERSRKQYTTYLQRWRLYCSQRDIDPIFPPVAAGINFLGELFHQGIGYSALNMARSALQLYRCLQYNIWDTLVCRIIKGVFELRPSLPRDQEIWDA